MDEVKRSFKGIWIPKEIWEDKRLTPTEKCLLAEIASLDNGDGCYASNEYFATFFNSSDRNIRYGLTKLKELGFIKQIDFDGRTRRLQIDAKYFQSGWKNISTLRGNEFHGSNVSNLNNINNIYNKEDNKVYSKDYIENPKFDKFWKAYPKKDGKANARKAFEKLKVTNEKLETMLKAIEWFKESRQWQEKQGQFIPMASTWLNQQRWEDYTSNEQDYISTTPQKSKEQIEKEDEEMSKWDNVEF